MDHANSACMKINQRLEEWNDVINGLQVNYLELDVRIVLENRILYIQMNLVN